MDDAAELVVLDQGPGFPDDLLSRLFERFARGDVSRSRTTGGVGLGLAIAHAIASAHDGSIVASQRDGGGAQVIVTLPLVQRRSVPMPEPTGKPSTSRRSGHQLLVREPVARP